jgi:hypothetical protein
MRSSLGTGANRGTKWRCAMPVRTLDVPGFETGHPFGVEATAVIA